MRESRPELLERLERLQPLHGIRGHRLARRRNQIGVSSMVRPSHAAAQLVNLGKPEAIGAIDDDGVGRGYIDAAFDDGGAYQYVEAAVIEIQHELFQLTFTHLTMPHRDMRLGPEFANGLRGLLDGLDGVMDEIDLSAAANLAPG